MTPALKGLAHAELAKNNNNDFLHEFVFLIVLCTIIL